MFRRQTYTVSIAGLKRKLPLFEVASGVKIAIFNILGDTQIVIRAAEELAKRIPKNGEVIVTPEVKSIPLAYELSKRLKIPYIVVRKRIKPYMVNSIKVEVFSITTGKPQTLWLDGKDESILKGKRVILVDDVVSTGNTMAGLRKLMKKMKAKVVAEATVFTEGDKNKWKHIISLGHLPIFIEKKSEKGKSKG